MLTRLTIQNYILIRQLEITFPDGFSVITGETGSGKSILLGALGMIIGQRADIDVLMDKSSKCIVEGTFDITGYHLGPLFALHDLDFDENLVIRREINPAGKSRAFINDTPVSVGLLKEMGERLVNIHSQNAVITLNDSNFQLAVIDSYAGLQPQVNDFRNRFDGYSGQKRLLASMVKKEAAAAGERDYLQFLLDELIAARLQEGELPMMEEKLNILRHAEEIKGHLFEAAGLLNHNEPNILNLVSETMKSLGTIEKYNQKYFLLSERLKVNYIDLKDLFNEITALADEVEIDPEELQRLSQRQDQLYRLLKKHQKSSIEDLIALRDSIVLQINSFSNLKDQIGTLEKEVTLAEAELQELAGTISEARKMIAGKFGQDIIATLARLGIPHARFQIEFLGQTEITRDGMDKIRFYFSANKGIDLRDLSIAASGGELSRIMLGVKSMISERNLLPTIIFDEIDNGVSGEIAGKVGSILSSMGRKMQVIAITHLPQIAGMGQCHFRVYKTEEDKVGKTYIQRLSGEQRVEEIAKMLSNEIVTEAARRTAAELLNA